MAQDFETEYHKASIRFIWKYDIIEEYIPVINLAIYKTFDTIKFMTYAIENTDIESMGIIDNDNRKVGFGMYINNKKIKYMGSVYSIFRNQYRIIARGYDDLGGIRFPPPKLEDYIEFYRNTKMDYSEKELIDSWNHTQSLKRKITNFTTLANKSINRGRRVPPKLRFEVLKRDGFRCLICGRTSEDTKLHVDHIKPVFRGGKNKKEYLVTLCIDCNLGKGTSDLFD